HRVRASGFGVQNAENGPNSEPRTPNPPPARHLPFVLAGLAIMLALGLWWYVLVAMRDPTVMRTWWQEVSREGALDQDAGSPFIFFAFVAGGPAGSRLTSGGVGLGPGGRRGVGGPPGGRGAVLGLIGAALPLALMAIAHDRKDRYSLPMVLPAAIGLGGVLVE